MITPTSTPEQLHPEAAEVVVRAVATAGRTVIDELVGVQPWRPRILARAGRVASVALVSTRASLIAGDDVRLSLTVGAGAALELVEIGATVAHHVRGGPSARVAVSLQVEPGGSLVWRGQPVIAAAGCRALRATVAEVGVGGRLLLGETVALGRAREQPGALTARTRITYGGAPLIDEMLDTRDTETIGSAAVLGRHRLVRSLTLVGIVDEDPPDRAMRVHGPGMLWRSFASAESAADAVAGRWRSLVLADPAGVDTG